MTNAKVVVLTLAAGIAAIGCADLTEPGPGGGPAQPPENTAQTAAAQRPAPPAMPERPAAGERIHASHILIAFKGARRSQATRSKDEAKKLAGQPLARAKGGADFADLAKQFSDDPTAKARGGDLGTFERGAMVKPFADAAFALKPGEVSDIVETDFGFHIIKRTE